MRSSQYRAVPFEKRRQMLDRRYHALDEFAGHRRRRACLAPADDAARLYPHKHIVRAGEHALGPPDRLGQRQADRDRLDALDFHSDASAT